MDTWPATLPQLPQRNGFQRRPKPSVIAFGTEVGPGKRRRRSAARTIPISARFQIDVGLIPTFETFFHVTLADGALPFSWTDPVTGDAAAWLFDDSDPYDLAPALGRLWDLTTRLERQP
jgi:hypothetical protein